MKKISIKFDKDFYFSIIIGVIGMLTALSMFALSGYMISKSALGTPLYALMVLIVSIKLFGFVRAITRYVERLYSHRSTFTMLRDIRLELFEQLIPIVPNVFRRYRSSALLSQIVNNVERLQNILLRVYYPPIVIIITTMITILVIINWNLYVGLVIGGSLFVSVILIPSISSRRANQLAQLVQQHEERYIGDYYDFEKGHAELLRFKQYDTFKDKVYNKQKLYEHYKYKEQKFLSTYDFMLNVCAMLGIWFITVLSIWQIQEGGLNPIFFASTLMVAITLFEQAIPMTNFAYYRSDTKNSLKNIDEVINQTFKKNNQATTENYNLYEIEKLSFKYDFQERTTLKNINLTINNGQRVAIIGPSGSGKTTLLNILMGLYSNDEGLVAYRGNNMNRLTKEHYFNEINTMLQHNHFFEGTIRENLLIEQEDSQMEAALKKVNLEHFKLDDLLNDNASNISGGERQRLSIARLILRDANIWLLDEPTASLDTENEHIIMKHLLKLKDTIVIVTHNLKYLNQFDHIIVMNEGEILEQGSYSQLLEQRGYLADIIKYNEKIEVS